MKKLLVAAAEHQTRRHSNTNNVLVESYCLNNGLARGIANGCSASYSQQEAK
jgi:hypothetical protein